MNSYSLNMLSEEEITLDGHTLTWKRLECLSSLHLSEAHPISTWSEKPLQTVPPHPEMNCIIHSYWESSNLPELSLLFSPLLQPMTFPCCH